MGGFIELSYGGRAVVVNTDQIIYFEPEGEDRSIVYLFPDKALAVEHPYQEVLIMIESSNRP